MDYFNLLFDLVIHKKKTESRLKSDYTLSYPHYPHILTGFLEDNIVLK